MKTKNKLIKCTLICALHLIISSPKVSCQWVKFNGSLPAQAFLAGKDGDGTDLYIARAYHVNGTHIGKFRKGSNNALIPWGGIEHTKTDFEIFTGTGTWFPSSGDRPSTAIVGGNQENKTFFIARGQMGGKWHPGKATYEGNALKAWIPYGGKEHILTRFEVLAEEPFYGLYKIKNVNSGKYIVTPNGNPNETKVIQRGDIGQFDIVWNYNANNSGNYLCNIQTQKPLSSKNNIVDQDGWSRNEDESSFDIKKVGNAFMIVHKKSNKIVGVDNSSRNDGAVIKLFDYVASPSNNCLWKFEPFIFDDIEIVVKTGIDDLRGGNEAFLQIDGQKHPLNKKVGWGGNTSNTVRIRPCKISAISKINLIYDGNPRNGHPFDTYDNWNVDNIIIRAYSRSGNVLKLYESNEKTRFTGENRSRLIYLEFCTFVIPG